MAFTATMIGSLPKGPDLELHVRAVEADGEAFVDVREYVPSSETYGRGVLVPREGIKALAKLLREA